MSNQYPLGDLLIKTNEGLAMRTHDDSIIFLMSKDTKPKVEEGKMLYMLDTTEVFVPYKGKWTSLE